MTPMPLTLSWQNWDWASSNSKRNCSFSKQDIAIEKDQIQLKGKLKVEVEDHLQLLKIEFKCYFSDLSRARMFFPKICRRNFQK